MDDQTGTTKGDAFDPLKKAGLVILPQKPSVPPPSVPPPPVQNEPELEARIIEETIIQPAPPIAPPLPPQRVEIKAPEPLPKTSPLVPPISVPPASAPVAPTPPPIRENIPNIPPISAPPKPSANPEPRITFAAPPIKQADAISRDIGVVLQSTKLAESRLQNDAPPPPGKTYDTSLARALDEKASAGTAPEEPTPQAQAHVSSVVAPLHTLKQDLQS